MSSSASNERRLVFSYTVCLYVASVAALMSAASHEMLLVMTQQEEPSEAMTALFRFLQTVDLTLFAATLIVAILRSIKSPLARPTTAAVSILLITWAPFGTARFIWWVGWVRVRERPEGREAQQESPHSAWRR